MSFEYKPIEFVRTRKIDLPEHPISSKAFENKIFNKIASVLESRVLKINHNLEIYESIYRAPMGPDYVENDIGRIRHYKASDNSAIIVLPQRGSGYNFAQLFASYFATNGISAYELETPFHGSRLPTGARSVCDIPIDLDIAKRIFKQAVTETRGLVDLIEEENIGICGISLGAIYASLAYGVDDRISSSCLVLGGGNLADMFFESQDKFAEYFKDYLIKKGISKEELRKELEEIEPCNHTKNKSDNLFMINAIQDKDVPEEHAKQLRQAWRNPEQYLVDAGHISIVKHISEILSKILEHYKKTL